ncbi:virginiamycin B lyase family protein [Nocardioides humi]|uniref:Virginiamycin B lyase n=1 Tax=Nocardioides humi TaxID=449461 RepID=A0ABN1ZPQ2_9ACTN|nr:hypothetical protein [Nocardioides humi]
MRIRRCAAAAAGTLLLASLAGVEAGAARAEEGAPERPGRAPTIATYPVPTADAGLDSLVVGPDGQLWFTERKGWKLGRITAAGAITEFPVPPMGGGSGPSDIVRGADGYLWFLTDSRFRLGRATTGGTVERVAEAPLATIFSDLAAGRGRGVWLTQADGGQVHRLLDADTNPAQGWSLATSYLSPTPMAVAPDGALWYGDGAGYLKRLDEAGNQTNHPISWGNSNIDSTSLAFGSDGALWATGFAPGTPLSTAEGGSVGRFDGTSLRAWPLPELATHVDPVPGSMTAGPDGALWWAEDGAIGRITTTGVISRVRIAPHDPDDIAFGPDGRLWFLDTGANRVGAITVDANLFPARQVARKVKLRAVSGRRVKGRVVTAEPGCRAGKVVAYAKPRKGKARKIGAGRAKANGKFSVKLRKRPGGKVFVKVKASAPAADVRCLPAKSRAR